MVASFIPMRSANSTALITDDFPSGTTSSSSPHRSATIASMGRAVKDMILALPGPTLRCSFWDRPQHGARPNLTCVSRNFVVPSPISTSHASASSNPPVMQCPFRAPMIGTPTLPIWWTGLLSRWCGRSLDCARGSGGPERSAPAQNDGPFPVKIPAATSPSSSFETSSTTSRKIRARRMHTSVLKQLSRSGRLREMRIARLPDSGRSTSLRRTTDAVAVGADIFD
mmetsp:Transcript_22060/g.44639  ORF Transcript_22060/g.44639 Transcript_22060/m.44639 type:complete len:226 (+) Transcript_22060:171-848(+)